MKILKSHTYGNGRRTVTLELTEAEVRNGYQLMLIVDGGMYRLGGQLDEVVPAHVITDAHTVLWDHFSQKWIE